MGRRRLISLLTLVCIAFLPAAAGAAVSDWYGTWQATYAGDSSGSCSVTVGAGNASQASVSMSCSSTSGYPPFSGSGSITASGTLDLGGSATGTTGGYTLQLTFGGMLQGDGGQGQWSGSLLTPIGTLPESGTWMMTRVSPPQPVATDPNQPVASPPTAQTEYTAPAGQLPTDAVMPSATGTLGRASLSVTLNPSMIPLGTFSSLGQFASTYRIYVLALLPGGVLGLTEATFGVLAETTPGNHDWGVISTPVGAYMSNIAQNAVDPAVIGILENLDVTGLLGTEFYVGYGIDESEMLEHSRYRGVYIVR